MSYGGGVEDSVRIGGTGPTQWLYNNKLRLVGVKLYGDGALGSPAPTTRAPAPRSTSTRVSNASLIS